MQVSAGGNHTLLLRSDGKAFMIGDIWPFRVSGLFGKVAGFCLKVGLNVGANLVRVKGVL